ncbi:hypothetical protein ACF1BN_35055 [Streptomyces sp. NPDC014861]|uniref:hypothetical protein n=1 Tax=Streptomyces sp. NPDC014861 TaxID=3364923 RepID=UPI0036FE760C
MSEAAFTGVQNPSGPVNTGPGTQTNYVTIYHFHEAGTSFGRAPLPRPLSHDHLSWLGHRFVPPLGMRAAAAKLRSERVVLIDAPPGSGRDTAARMLLKETPGPRTARRLLPEDDNAGSALSGDQVSDGDRLLLDLSDARRGWETLQGQLPGLVESVRMHRAHLVVILPHGASVDDGLVVHRAVIERPDALRVLMRTIRAEDVPGLLSPDQLSPAVHTFLAGAPALREVGRLARLLGEARRAEPGAGPDRWSSVALEGLIHLGEAVADHVRKLSDGGQRALLLTVAMLPGARLAALHHARRLLLEAVRHPHDERPVFEHEDLGEQLDRVDAAIRTDGYVEFRRPGFAVAIRDHFWSNRPDLWDVLRHWVDVCLRLPGLRHEDRDDLVAGFAEQTLRLDQHDHLLGLAREWIQQNDGTLLQAAVQALGHGLNDPRAGRSFRQFVYRWSLEPRIHAWTAQVLVAVSADVIATSHPDQALVRLHHLARGAHGPRSGADDRLLRLARTDGRLYRKLLDRLALGLARDVRQPDTRVFRTVAASSVLLEASTGSRPLIEDARTRETLLNAWRAVFAGSGPGDWLEPAEEWLAAARPGDDLGQTLLEVLVGAAAHRPGALDHLYVASLRHPCAARVRRLVDTAQGVLPAPAPRG